MSDEFITEFTWVEPDAVHLVGVSANGFPAPLLAKAAEALDDVLGLAAAYSEDGCVKYVSEEARDKYAKSGVAMPNGDFPIQDEGHLQSAIGHLGGYTGDKSAAKAHIIKRAKALGKTDMLPDDWGVSKGDGMDEDTEKTVSTGESESQTHDNIEGNHGSTDPHNDDHGDPRSVSFPHGAHDDGHGETPPTTDTHQGEAESQTHDNIEGNAKAASDSDDDKCDDDDDDDDDSKKESIEDQLQGVISAYVELEKAEGGAPKSLRRIARIAAEVLKTPELLRKAEEMTSDELVKALGELDSARREEKKTRKAEEAAKAAEEAAKVAEQEATEATESAEKSAAERLEELEALVAKLADEPAARPFLSAAGVTAALRGPDADSILKEFDARVEEAEDKVAKARNDYELRKANEELSMANHQRMSAKLVAKENYRQTSGRLNSRFGPDTMEIFNSGLNTLPDDPTVKGV